MEVRCERCKTEYEFDDAGVSDAGVAVQCSTCGYIFKVKRKAVLVTMPMQPGDTPTAPGSPPEATAPAAPAAQQTPQREWKVRQPNGIQFTFRELTTLQKWIVEGKVGRDAEISLAGTEHWKRLGNIGALAPFFKVVDDAHRGVWHQVPPSAPVQEVAPLDPPPSVPTAQQGFPEISPASPQPAAMAASEFGHLAPIRTIPGPQLPSVIVEGLDYEQPEEGKSPAASLLLLLSIVLLGAGGYYGYVYYWQPQKLREEAVARESARAAEVERKREEAAALERSKELEEARARAERDAERDAQPARAASEVDAGAAAPSSADAGTALAQKRPSSKTSAQRGARPEARNFDYYITEGYRLLEKQSPTLALDSFAKAADLRPDRAEPFAGRGLALLDMGDLSQAEASFQEALTLNSHFGIAVIGLAKTYLAQGRKDKAADYYGRYLEILPDGPEANGAKLALKRLRQE